MTTTSRARTLRALLSMLACGVTVNAQTTTSSVASPGTASPPPPASAGLANDWLREQTQFFASFDLGGQFRARFVDQTYLKGVTH